MLIRKLSPSHALFLALTAVAAAPFIAACGGSNNPPQNPQAGANCPPGAAPGYPGCTPGGPGGVPPGGTYPPPGPGGTYPPPGPGGTYPTATAPTAPPTQPTAPTPTPTAPPPIGGDAVDVAIKGIAMMYAPGMQPEGQRVNLSVMEGKDASTSISLQGGKCYTIIGVGQGVMSLEMQLALPLMTAPVGSDASATPNATIGKGAAAVCPITPLPVPYTLRVIARKGSGSVGVQVFSKLK